jgi:acyl-CoA synthetase (AMP-forming)/AMP-acid ligase II
MVPLTHGNLIRSARNIAATLQLGPEDRCLNLMPMFHIHGIVACLLAPLVSGGRVIAAQSLDASGFFHLLTERQATWYSAVPTRHRNFLDHARQFPKAAEKHTLRFIRSSSAALPATVLEELETVFRVPVIEAYGMTEAAHQMCSNPLPPGKRKTGSVGLTAGPEVAIVDAEGGLLPTGSTGEVVIRGENVTPGYVGLPTEQQGRMAGGWFRTGDIGRFDEEGYLFLSGRVKEIVNRGGEKVSPAEVDAVLLEHPAVAEAACFGIPHSTLGEDLAAAVRLHPGREADEAMLRGFLFERLSHFKIPSRILIVGSIPKSSIGKVQRKRLAEALHDSLSAKAAMPANPAEAYVADIFRQVIPGCGPVGRYDNFFSLGGDSLHGIRAAHMIGAHYRIEMPAHEIFRHPTPVALSRRIEELRSAQMLDVLESRLSRLSEEQLIAFLNKGMTDN